MRRALTLILVLISATVFANERTFEQSFDVTADAEFSLDCHKGTIRVRTHQAPVIQVRARIYPDQGHDPELVDMVRIEPRSGSDYVAIEVEYERPEERFGGLLGGSATLPLIDFEILVPDDAALKLSSHKCEFDVEAGTGLVEIDSHKGKGTIRDVRNELELQTHAGRFEVEVTQLADLSVETHKGKIALEIHGAYDFSIRGDTHGGDFRVDGRDVQIKKERHGHSIDYREGSGHNRIRLSTHAGSIGLRFVN
ncbi:MAG: DUF4097 family beta strand repeat protein [bacterium]|nr:DUF4097 family beta strand repeat protein [bacterium]